MSRETPGTYVKIIPNLMTLGSIACGFFSVVFATKGEFLLAGYLIILAGFFDATDGIVARALNTSSKFGVELDSLADVISFGFAPSYLIYTSQFSHLGHWGVAVSSLLLIFGAIRLARFNAELTGFGKEYYYGLPIPVAALTVTFYTFTFGNDAVLPNEYVPISIILLVSISLLMVSRVRYEALPLLFKTSPKKNPVPLISFLLSVAAIFYFGKQAIFYIFLFVILFGIFRYVILFMKKASLGDSGSKAKS